MSTTTRSRSENHTGTTFCCPVCSDSVTVFTCTGDRTVAQVGHRCRRKMDRWVEWKVEGE